MFTAGPLMKALWRRCPPSAAAPAEPAAADLAQAVVADVCAPATSSWSRARTASAWPLIVAALKERVRRDRRPPGVPGMRTHADLACRLSAPYLSALNVFRYITFRDRRAPTATALLFVFWFGPRDHLAAARSSRARASRSATTGRSRTF